LSDRPRFARQTTVDACQALLEIGPLLVAPDDDVIAILRRAAVHPETRLLGVTGPDGRIVGVIPILRLAESIIARVSPESLLANVGDLAAAARFTHSIEDRTAADIMLEPATIRGTATVADAFRLMRQRSLSGLYVVDEDGRPTGYLDLLELAVRSADELDLGHPTEA
jgi:CBS domain-containing protein